MFDAQWNSLYQTHQMAQYPCGELIRFVARNYYHLEPIKRAETRFLDIGCGAGSSTWYLTREGFRVTAIDGSEQAISILKERLLFDRRFYQMPLFDAYVGDLCQAQWEENTFDCAIDISSLCYVPDNNINHVLEQVGKALKPGGRFLSVMPARTCARPPFENTGGSLDVYCRFWSSREIRNVFGRYFLMNALSRSEYISGSYPISLYVFEGQRRAA